ncbi:hypothetical protein TKK_0003420 [Trichogramma kaykai]
MPTGASTSEIGGAVGGGGGGGGGEKKICGDGESSSSASCSIAAYHGTNVKLERDVYVIEPAKVSFNETIS